MEDAWKVISSEVVYDGRFQVVRDELKRPDGSLQDYTWIPSGGAVAVLAFDDSGRVVVTRQYRHPIGRTIFDLPAGGINPGEAEVDAARRELREETGYRAGNLSQIGAFYQSAGRLATAVIVFAAFDLSPGPTDPDDGEIIEIEHMPWNKLLDFVLTEQPVDSALAYAVLLWHAKGTSGQGPRTT